LRIPRSGKNANYGEENRNSRCVSAQRCGRHM